MSTSVLPISARKTGEFARLLEERGYGDGEFQLLNDNLGRVLALINELGAPTIQANNWLEVILEAERKIHLTFFGQELDLSFFKQVLEQYGQKKVTEWKKLWLEPHFLPKVAFASDSNFPGWKIKPKNEFWQMLSVGSLKVRDNNDNLVPILQVGFVGQVVLVDIRLKPAFKNGAQMYVNDSKLLGPIIKKLREGQKIEQYNNGPQSSRFGVSSEEIDKFVIAEYAKRIGLSEGQMQLESVIMGNVFAQLFPDMSRSKDGQTNTSVWYNEFLQDGSNRLYGGYSDYGGLAYVNGIDVRVHWSDRSFRLLGVLGTLET